MPAFDAKRLEALAQQLQAAATAQDWVRLGQLDQLLSQWLAEEQAMPSADPAQQAAWHRVASAHGQARSACQQALQEAGARLRDLHNHNEAHKAYAWQEQLS